MPADGLVTMCFELIQEVFKDLIREGEFLRDTSIYDRVAMVTAPDQSIDVNLPVKCRKC